jgi:uncharacterized membrane protein (DUF106 family)
VTLINRIVGGIVGVLMPVLGALGPALGVAVLSLATAVALLLVVRAASNQSRIVAVKRSIRAALFEIPLFNDDLRAILRAQGEILRHNLTYLRLSLAPMLWVLVPLLLLMAHLQAYYGYAGMEPGRSALVKVALDDGWRGAQDADLAAGPELTLEPPPGIRVETPRVWIPSLNEATWRIAAERSGDYELIVRMKGTPFAKTVHASNTVAARSAVRPAAGTIDQWLHPVEPPLPPASMLRSIAVGYPERAIRILGWDIHWTIVFFGLTMIFAFALKGRFGVVW